MQLIKHIFNKHRIEFVTFLIIVIFTVLLKVSAISGGPFTTGETLNPDCYPSDTNCIVKIFPTDAVGSLKNDGVGNLTWATVFPTNAAGALKNDGSGNLSWGASGSTIAGLTENYLTKSNAAGDNIVNSLIFDNGTNVGIGTVIPTFTLSLSGTADRTIGMERNTNIIGGENLIISAGGAHLGTANLIGGDLELKSGISTGQYGSSMRFFTATAGLVGTVDNTPSEKMTILPNGNVGIGNNNPDQILNLFAGPEQGNITAIRMQNTLTGMNGLKGMEIGIDPGATGYVLNLQNYDMILGVNNLESLHMYATTNDASFAHKLNVGGAATPVTSLDVRGAGVNSEFYNTTNGGNTDHYWSGNNTGGTVKYMVQRWTANDATNGAMYFIPNSGNASLTLLSNGSVYNLGGGAVATNTAFGVNALLANTTGANNVAMGYNSLTANNGDQNVSIGVNSMLFSATANYNVAIGQAALASTNGTYNVAVGWQSMLSATGGDENTAIGRQALYSNTGSTNTAIASGALFSNTSGSNNSAIGYHSLYTNTIGGDNTAFGRFASVYNVSGNSNTAIGDGALQTNITGNDNTSLGTQAGWTSTKSGSVFLGNFAGHYSDDSSVLYIDNQDRGSSANEKTNSLIYGIFAAAPANQTLQINAATGILGNLQVGSSGAAKGITLYDTTSPTTAYCLTIASGAVAVGAGVCP